MKLTKEILKETTYNLEQKVRDYDKMVTDEWRYDELDLYRHDINEIREGRKTPIKYGDETLWGFQFDRKVLNESTPMFKQEIYILNNEILPTRKATREYKAVYPYVEHRWNDEQKMYYSHYEYYIAKREPSEVLIYMNSVRDNMDDYNDKIYKECVPYIACGVLDKTDAVYFINPAYYTQDELDYIAKLYEKNTGISIELIRSWNPCKDNKFMYYAWHKGLDLETADFQYAFDLFPDFNVTMKRSPCKLPASSEKSNTNEDDCQYYCVNEDGNRLSEYYSNLGAIYSVATQICRKTKKGIAIMSDKTNSVVCMLAYPSESEVNE